MGRAEAETATLPLHSSSGTPCPLRETWTHSFKAIVANPQPPPPARSELPPWIDSLPGPHPHLSDNLVSLGLGSATMSHPLLPLKNWTSLLVALSSGFPNLVGLKLLGAWEEVWGCARASPGATRIRQQCSHWPRLHGQKAPSKKETTCSQTTLGIGWTAAVPILQMRHSGLRKGNEMSP